MHSLLNAILGMLAFGSIAFWVWALAQKASARRLLPIVTRRNVPWRGPEVALILMMWLIVPASVVQLTRYWMEPQGGSQIEEEAGHVTPEILFAYSLSMLGFVVAVILVFRLVRRASPEDMGLGGGSIVGLTGIGTVGFVAALVPVYSIQKVLTWIVPMEESQHQILKLLENNRDLSTLVATIFSASIAAPIVEEFLFRAFLQGWLEACFCKRDLVQHSAAARASEPVVKPEETVSDDHCNDLALGASEDLDASQQDFDLDRFGFLPILISSTAFALAHVDNWPAPIPLFVLALILGYIYHRTHRLLPCVVLHMLFNSLSLVVAWWGDQ